jgi:hypothetical protein
MCTWRKAERIHKRETHFFSSERMLHKDCDRKDSVEEKNLLIVGLKGLDAETNWLALNRKS